MEQDKTMVADIEQPQQTVQMVVPAPGATQVLTPAQCPICGQANPPGESYCVECGFLLTSEVPETPTEERAYAKLRDTIGGREYLLKAGANLVGRDPTADVLLSDGTVSRRHAQITIEENAAYIEDLGSTNGTQLNGQPLSPGQRMPVATGAELRFGSVTLVVELPEGFVTPEVAPPVAEEPVAYLTSTTDPDQRFPLFARPNRIGRRPANDIVLADPYVSGQHALIEISGTTIRLTDLGSTNGTFVNGNRLPPNVPTVIEPDQVFTLGQNRFVIEWAPVPAAEEEEAVEEPGTEEPPAVEEAEATAEALPEAGEEEQTTG